MRAALYSVAALSAVVVAQPHAAHRHGHAKKDVVYETDYVTAYAAGPVVYVDANGNPVSTSWPAAAAAPSDPSPVAAYAPPATSSSSSITYVAPAAVSTSSSAAYVAPAYVAPAYTPPAPAAAAASPAAPAAPAHSAASAPSSPSSGGHGITYSPYNSDGSCKSQSQVSSDFQKITGYDIVRIYGTDCNQVQTVYNAATAKGMKLFVGIFDINQVEAEAKTIISAVNGNWAAINTVSVGNEGVNSGTYSVAQIGAAVSQAKSVLAAAGYTGAVVTVDTFVAIIANPGLCEVGDFVATNCHAFFDGGILAEAAGAFVLAQVEAVSAVCGGKKTVISETGWPSSGSANKLAVPSEANQQAAVNSIKAAFSSNVFLFTAFNDHWKQNNAGTYGAEQFWGIYGNA